MSEEWQYEDHELEAAVKERLTPVFLETLVMAVRLVAWDVDMVEIIDFARDLFHLAGQPFPSDLTAF